MRPMALARSERVHWPGRRGVPAQAGAGPRARTREENGW